MSTFKKLKSLFFKQLDTDSGVKPTAALSDAEPKIFKLILGKVHIGNLQYAKAQWSFAYTEDYKLKVASGDAKPVIGFPKIDEEYISDVLWPFFHIRLPGSYIEREPDLANLSEAKLLELFGRRSVLNPYEVALVD